MDTITLAGDVQAETIRMVEIEVERLRELGRRSSNLNISAIASAASCVAVQNLMALKLSTGNHFEGVSILNKGTEGELGILFQFESPRDRIDLIPPSFLVNVDALSGDVLSIEDPCVKIPGRTRDTTLYPAGPLPFALLVPSTAPEVAIPNSDLEEIRRRKTEFIRNLAFAADDEGGCPRVSCRLSTAERPIR
jgi:hypothetical protein